MVVRPVEPNEQGECPEQTKLNTADKKCYSKCPQDTENIGSFCVPCEQGFHAPVDGVCQFVNCANRQLRYRFGTVCVRRCPLGTVQYGGECNLRCPSNLYAFHGECIEACPPFALEVRTRTRGWRCEFSCAVFGQYRLLDQCVERCPQYFPGQLADVETVCAQNFSYSQKFECVSKNKLAASNALPYYQFGKDASGQLECVQPLILEGL